MVCYACSRAAAAECPRCERAYCAQHGSTTCNVCASPASVFASAALYRSTVAASAALVALAGAYLLWWPDTTPTPTRLVLAAQPGSLRPGSLPSAAQRSQTTTDSSPAAAPSPAPSPTPPPQRKYTVAGGDTLLDIADRFNTTVDELLRLNGLTNAGRLSIGQELVLDPAPPAGAAAGGASAPDPARTYTVRAGDTLLGIALRNDTSVDELARANGFGPDALLRIGQSLVLPENQPAPAAATTSPTPAPASPTPTPAPVRRTYTVTAGDTLWDIAVKTGTSIGNLTRLNNITENTLLRLGQELVVSDGGAPSQGASSAPRPPRKHTIVRDDTLVEIAARYGTTVSQLLRLNNLSATSLLTIGQELELP